MTKAIEETPEEYVSVTRARQLMGVSSATLAKLIADEILPTHPSTEHKQMKLLRLQDIRRWLEVHGPPQKRRKVKRMRQPAPRERQFGPEDIKKNRPAA